LERKQPRPGPAAVELLMQELMESIERRYGNNVMIF
jgi:hypothetical protein